MRTVVPPPSISHHSSFSHIGNVIGVYAIEFRARMCCNYLIKTNSHQGGVLFLKKKKKNEMQVVLLVWIYHTELLIVVRGPTLSHKKDLFKAENIVSRDKKENSQ